MARDREVVLQIDPAPAHELLAGDGGPVLVDIREPWELEQGRIAGSVHIPMAELDEKLEPYRERSIVLYCAHGNRSLRAAKAFSEQGYGEVVSLAGGIDAWGKAGLPLDLPDGLDEAQLARYSRHLLIPEIGVRGQKRLLDCAGAAHRRRRAGLARSALPGGGRSRATRDRG